MLKDCSLYNSNILILFYKLTSRSGIYYFRPNYLSGAAKLFPALQDLTIWNFDSEYSSSLQVYSGLHTHPPPCRDTVVYIEDLIIWNFDSEYSSPLQVHSGHQNKEKRIWI